MQSCEPAEEINEIVIPKLVAAQQIMRPELIALTIAMLFGLIGVLGLHSNQLSRTMRRVLAVAHITLVLSIVGLLAMTFAEQSATGLISTVGHVVADNWSITATLMGIIGVVGAELALRGFRLPKIPEVRIYAKTKLLKKISERLQKKHARHVQNAAHSEHVELAERMHTFEHTLDRRLTHYGNALHMLRHSATYLLHEHAKLRHEHAKLKHAHSSHAEKGIVSILELPKISVTKVVHPKLTMPKLTLPKISMPKLAFPKLSAPKLNTLRFTLPRFNMPKLSLPKLAVPKISVPKFAIPKIKITVPKLAVLKASVPKINIFRQPTAQLPKQEALPTKSSFTVDKNVSQNITQILDLNPAEAVRTKQRIVMDKHKRAAIARMRTQFGLPPKPESRLRNKTQAGMRRQL